MPPPPPSPATWDRLFSLLSFFAGNVSGGLWLFTQCPSPLPGQEPLRAERQLSDTAGLDKDLTRAEWRDDGLLSSGVGGSVLNSVTVIGISVSSTTKGQKNKADLSSFGEVLTPPGVQS